MCFVLVPSLFISLYFNDMLGDSEVMLQANKVFLKSPWCQCRGWWDGLKTLGVSKEVILGSSGILIILTGFPEDFFFIKMHMMGASEMCPFYKQKDQETVTSINSFDKNM